MNDLATNLRLSHASPMNTKDIRRENLKRLIAERFGGSKSSFGRELGRTSAQISQWLSEGKSSSRNLGDQVAREIEAKLGLEENWLDIDRGTSKDIDQYLLTRCILSAKKVLLESGTKPSEEEVARVAAIVYSEVKDEKGDSDFFDKLINKFARLVLRLK